METQIQKKPFDVLKSMLSQENVKSRFADVLGDKAPAFISSIISAVNLNNSLQQCSPNTILGSAAIAAALDLPITPSLSFAALIPFKNNRTGEYQATFQVMKGGYVQLAMRSGQFETINVVSVYDGELVGEDRFTGEYQFDSSKKKSDTIIGYYSYFRLTNGFRKGLYMTVSDVEKHAKRFSQSYRGKSGLWSDKEFGFHKMGEKTVLKLLLSKYAPLSVATQLHTAIQRDSAVNKAVIVNNEQEVAFEIAEAEYIDNPADPIAPEKSELDILTDKIITHIDGNKNKVNEEIRNNCIKLKGEGKWTIEEAMKVCTLLNVDVL